MAAAHPGLVRVDLENQLVLRADAPVQGKVGLVSGGGSGHEPLHGGLRRRRHARRRLRRRGVHLAGARPDGAPPPGPSTAAPACVHIVKNYTGDVLNFRMAAELAEDEGIEVAERRPATTTVAVQDSLYTAGRRGTGATVLAEKIAGRPRRGRRLAGRGGRRRPQGERPGALVRRRPDVVRDARPRARPIFDLGPDEIEVGVGIHGEPGRRREKHAPRPRDRRDDARRRSSTTSQPASGIVRAGLRQRPRRHAADRALPALQRGRTGSSASAASRSAAASSATTSRASRWRAPRSPCSCSTTS